MTIGGSVFLIAAGAILRYAITVNVQGVDIGVVGLILMIAGVVALVASLFVMTQQGGNRPPSDRY